MWEHLTAHYRVEKDLTGINNILTSYGKDGWELINIIDDHTGDSPSDKIFFFKRQIIKKQMQKYQYKFGSIESFNGAKQFIRKNSEEGWKLSSHMCTYFGNTTSYVHYVIMEMEK